MFRNIPIVTKNLLIINIVVFLASSVVQIGGRSLEDWGALHFFMASNFHLYQFVTYQFMHGGFAHLFFNMFALWMFGCVIENVWGPRKFIFYYIFCGIGAGICQELVQYVQFAADGLTAMDPQQVLNVNGSRLMTVDQVLSLSSTIGASGAIYAILLAFGMTFPNERIFIFPLPVPIKAKWFVIIYAAIELFSAMTSAGDGVAHMAHLGGMLFGFLLIVYWRRHPGNYFDLNSGRQFFDRWASRRTGHSAQREQSGPVNRPKDDAIDMEYNARKKARQDEIDAILDKIRQSGYDSLSKAEKQRLFEASHER